MWFVLFDDRLFVGFKASGAAFEAARERYGAWRAAELAGEEVPAELDSGVAEAGAARAIPLALGEPARAIAEQLERMAVRLARRGAMSEALRRKSGFVEELAESIRLFSLNAILAAHRVSEADAIGTVASLMQTRSEAAGPEIHALGAEIERAAALLRSAGLLTAAARLLCELPLLFDPLPAELVTAIAETVSSAVDAAAALEASLDRLAGV